MTAVEIRPFEVGKESLLVVGMEGVVEKVTKETVTIGGVTLPLRLDDARGVRYLSLLWPQDDPSNCDRACCAGVAEDAADDDARDDLERLAALVRAEHYENHPGSMRFCQESATCREVDQ